MLSRMISFCSRLAATPAGDDTVSIEIVLKPTNRRKLFADSPLRILGPYYEAHTDQVLVAHEVSRVELLANEQEIASRAVATVFGDFGLKADPRMVNGLLAEVRK